ncbi:MAG: 5-(carboxyamino)imidazole ribonucleotide synthase [Firmicutes bacterium]|nr:5-(carboxyamino)imidazole ribonucleotide synthase [Bacillota bacterium]
MSVLPAGSTIGIIGGGQLGRLTALEARRLGYRTCVWDPQPGSPAAQVADAQIVAAFGDPDAAEALARRVQVATYEFENVPAGTVEQLEARIPVYPGSRMLRITQHRLREKETLSRWGFPVPRFAAVRTLPDLHAALARVPLPVVLKTATGGYDGKGQAVAHTAAEAEAAYRRLIARSDALIVEEFLDLALELSVICARDRRGQTAWFPPAENRHREGILDLSAVPARVDAAVASQARELALGIIRQLELVGVLAVEMFLTRAGRLLVNELAPRPHNSGHYTLDACATSQFEQLVRAVTGLPLGSPVLYAPAAMANLLGDLWPPAGQPDFGPVLAVPGVRLYLYGKDEARPGRKMGHLTCVAGPVETAVERVLSARSRLSGTRQPA